MFCNTYPELKNHRAILNWIMIYNMSTYFIYALIFYCLFDSLYDKIDGGNSHMLSIKMRAGTSSVQPGLDHLVAGGLWDYTTGVVAQIMYKRRV